MVDVAAGTYSSFALTSDGRVEAWGLNNYGQLGLPVSAQAAFSPSVVNALAEEKVVAVGGGQHHTLAVTEVRLDVAADGGGAGRQDGVQVPHPSHINCSGQPVPDFTDSGQQAANVGAADVLRTGACCLFESPLTLYMIPHVNESAFMRDGKLLAWGGRCKSGWGALFVFGSS